MSSQNELLQALVNELPYVQSLVSEIKDLKKEVKRETKQTKKWKKKHDALLNILHDYPRLMGTVKNEVVDLTSVEEEDVSSIRISYDPVQIKTENIVEDDEMSIEDGEIIETPQQKKEALELTAVNQVSDEEMEVEVEEEEDEEEEEEVEEEEIEIEEEVDDEEEEEEEELFELEIKGKTYFVTDENNGVIYEALEDDDVGEMLGNLKNGKPIWNKTQNTKK